MSNFVARLEFEHEELVERVKKLSTFLFSTDSCGINKEQFSLLEEQLVVMRKYRDILEKRLKLIYAEGRNEQSE